MISSTCSCVMSLFTVDSRLPSGGSTYFEGLAVVCSSGCGGAADIDAASVDLQPESQNAKPIANTAAAAALRVPAIPAHTNRVLDISARPRLVAVFGRVVVDADDRQAAAVALDREHDAALT